MKQNKFTMWLFNFLHKTRIKEVTTTTSGGSSFTYYQAQRRTSDFSWQNIYKDVDFSGLTGNFYCKWNTLEYEKLRIDQWLESKRKQFFTTTKTKYIKYP